MKYDRVVNKLLTKDAGSRISVNAHVQNQFNEQLLL